MEHYYLAFDAGTQSVKVAVYDKNMKCVAKSSNRTTLKYPHPGWVDMDADEYLLLTRLGMKQCIEQLKKQEIDPNLIKVIMGDGIICGIVGIDESGKAITPYINYLDSRTQSDVEVLKKLNLDIWGKETGNADPSCMFPALHARWILANNKEFQKRGKKFVHNAPYILMNLAGLESEDAFVDWGTMSGWGLGYRVYEKEWSDKQLDILGIAKSYMPKIVKPWNIIGTLSESAAKETGCPHGIPICAGAGDTMQSMLGSGILEANKAVDVAGTCAMFCVSTNGIIPELSKRGSELIFNSGTLENTYFYWGFVRTGGLALRWFKDNICQKSDDDSYYKLLSRGAEKVVPGCNGVIFLPYLTGGYGQFSKIKGCFLNMTLDTDQFALWRSVLEAIAYDYMEITNDYRNAGIKIDRITITEGGSKDDLWNQIKADIMQSETITLEVSGGAVLTDCIIGAYAEGDIEDLKEALVNNIKIINKYSPNANNSNVYKEQYVLRKSVLSGVDSNIK
ncbi:MULTISPECIES: FGGY-family carbohydrate kinase [Clostridium]|nr:MULTISPECIES: FGGY family carbohydrate kinase [Clostridium]AGY77800.1 FGGY family carbohydrate kinase [Clostridium autoethanogenum DSM 10061]ALU37935.1 Xylulokinase [Clostridium autoethanogenum DSM 10061]OAA88024.1 Xylulose kinase [Clostridium ljungdahlii DSM 13528]OVY49714.1 Xylulose kinase [Clostridium autoethanogenum]RMC99847.1 carbohydrate kinase [Clostridium autoethanogenum]